MSLPDDHPTAIILNKICGEDCICRDFFSEKNNENQIKLINELEYGFIKYNIGFNDVKIAEIVPIFFSMISFAHPLLIKYMKEKSCIGDYYSYKGIQYNVKKEVKEIIEYLYIHIKYGNLRGDATPEEHQIIIDEYAKLFNINYEKISYD